MGFNKGKAAYPPVTLGLLQADRQDHRAARDTFLMALRLIDPGKDARLYCYAHHNLAWMLCELGHYAAAAEALASGRDLYGKHPDLYTQSRLAWLEGKIAAAWGTSTRPRRRFSPSSGTSSRRATATTWP